MISVTFTCPVCGDVWTEDQDPLDEWFRLGVRQTLCDRCAAQEMERIKKHLEESYEILPCRTSSN